MGEEDFVQPALAAALTDVDHLTSDPQGFLYVEAIVDAADQLTYWTAVVPTICKRCECAMASAPTPAPPNLFGELLAVLLTELNGRRSTGELYFDHRSIACLVHEILAGKTPAGQRFPSVAVAVHFFDSKSINPLDELELVLHDARMLATILLGRECRCGPNRR